MCSVMSLHAIEANVTLEREALFRLQSLKAKQGSNRSARAAPVTATGWVRLGDTDGWAVPRPTRVVPPERDTPRARKQSHPARLRGPPHGAGLASEATPLLPCSAALARACLPMGGTRVIRRPSIIYEVLARFDSLKAIGISRHAAKRRLRARALAAGCPVPLAPSTGRIHADKTLDTYKGIALRYARWARETQGIRHLAALDAEAGRLVALCLEARLAAGDSPSTLATIRSALRILRRRVEAAHPHRGDGASPRSEQRTISPRGSAQRPGAAGSRSVSRSQRRACASTRFHAREAAPVETFGLIGGGAYGLTRCAMLGRLTRGQ